MSQDNIIRNLVVKIETDSTENIKNNEETSLINEEFQFTAQEYAPDDFDASSNAESDYEIISDSEARNNDAFFSKQDVQFHSYSISNCKTDHENIAEQRVFEKTEDVTQDHHASRAVPFRLNGEFSNELNFVPYTNLNVTEDILHEDRKFITNDTNVIFQSAPVTELVSVTDVKPIIGQEKFDNSICNARNIQRNVDLHPINRLEGKLSPRNAKVIFQSNDVPDSELVNAANGKSTIRQEKFNGYVKHKHVDCLSVNALEDKFNSCVTQKLNERINTTTVNPNFLQKKVCQSTTATNSELNVFEPCILSKIIREMLNEEVPAGAECGDPFSMSSSCLKANNVTNVPVNVPANVPDAIMTNQDELERDKPTESTESLNPETCTNQSYHFSKNQNQTRKRSMVSVGSVSLAQRNAAFDSRNKLDCQSATLSCSEVTSKHAKLEEITNVESRSCSAIQQETVYLSCNKFDRLLTSYAPLKFTEPQKTQGAVHEQQHPTNELTICRIDDFPAQDNVSRGISVVSKGKNKTAPAAPKKRILWTHKNPARQDNQTDPIEMQIAVLCEPNTKLDIGSLPLQTFGQKNLLVLIPDDVIPVISESDNVIPVTSEEVNGVPFVTEKCDATSLTAGSSAVESNGTGNACEIPVMMENGNILATTENENVLFVVAENNNTLPIGSAVAGNDGVAAVLENGNEAPVTKYVCETNNSLSSVVTENDSITVVVGENGDVIPVVNEDYSLAITQDHNFSSGLAEDGRMILVVAENGSNVPATKNDNTAPVFINNGSILPVAMENGLITLADNSLSSSTEYNDQSVSSLTKSTKSGSPQHLFKYELVTCSRCSVKFLHQPQPNKSKKFSVCRTDEPPNTCKSCCARIKRANYLNSHMLKITNRRYN